MYNLNTIENIGMRDNCVVPDVDCNFSQKLLVSKFADSSIFTNDLPSPNELLQNLCAGYGYNVDVETISEVSDDRFLQEYATKCGYQFTEDFLSVMNKYKIEFMDKVDSVIASLSNSFSFFLKEVERYNKDVMYLINRSSSCFSRRVYRLRPKCINILQFAIIPEIIKSIFDSKVIDGGSERKMTYVEMERLFLHFVDTLEKSIMGRMMKYWRDFCNENKIIFVEYNNPFACAYRFYRVSTPNIDYPASFVIRFGECISFMAAAKIDEIMSRFVVKLDGELSNFFSKCCFICNGSNDVASDLEKLLDKSPDLIKEEFDKKIIEESVKGNLSSFLKNILIWNKYGVAEINEVIINNVIETMRNLLLDRATNNTYKIINSFKQKLSLSERCSLIGELHIIEDKWGIKIHPEDACRISYIRSEFAAKSKRVVMDKFCALLRDGFKFLDGTVIDLVEWEIISENLFPIAQYAVKHLVDEEYAGLSKTLFEARILDDDGTRKATSEEIENILRFFSDSVCSKNRSLFCLVWRDLINSKKFNISKSSVQSKTISTWGLNIHPDDVRLIFFVKKKFSIQIKNGITRLFCNMLKKVTVLPSGNVLSGSSWILISGELFELATKSVQSIIKRQLLELGRVLSKARIVEVNEDNSCSYITRGVTDNEKKIIMTRIKKLIDEKVRNCTRSLWLRTVNKSLKIGYGYREKYKDISGMGTEGRWGVKLRYRDNTAILSVRRKFSSKIRDVLYNKFSRMLKNKHEFDDGTFIGLIPWFRVCKKLFPIVREEVIHIIDAESKELEGIISEACAVVDSRSVRELTIEEKSIILENIMKLVHFALKKWLSRYGIV